MAFRIGSKSRQYLILLLVCWWAFAFRFANPIFLNDHFDHLSKARQVLSGEHPTRDFFDDGRPLTIYASAIGQRISPTLLSEAILTTAGIAAGVGFVYMLAQSVSGSSLLALLAALLTVAMQSRLYSYPKALLFPWGLWLLWRYVDAPTHRRLAGLSLFTVVAFLFRYDYGVYLAALYVPVLLVVHKARVISALALYIGLALVFVSPYLAFLGPALLERSTGSPGLTDIRQSMPGMTRARVRLDLSRGLWFIGPPPPQVGVRWRADVSVETQRALEERYGLHERGRKIDGVSVRYFMDDPSPERVVRLIADPRVEDTSGVNRGTGALLEPTRWDRWQNAFPLFRLTPSTVFHTREDAQAWIYYVFFLSVPLALFVVWLAPRGTVPHETVKVLSLAWLCAVLQQFLIQGSLDSRLPDVAGPTAVLLAWLCARVVTAGAPRTGRVTAVMALASLSLVTWYGVNAYAETRFADVATAGLTSPGNLAAVARRLGGKPIDYYWPVEDSGGLSGLTRYVHECLSPDERLLVVSYAPEVFYLSERLFAGGMNKFDPSGFNSPSRDIMRRLRTQSVPLVIIDDKELPRFKADWAELARYFTSRYHEVAAVGFGSGNRTYHVLVDLQQIAVRTEPLWGLPCFDQDSEPMDEVEPIAARAPVTSRAD